MDKQDVLVLLPTGGGKSLCYQLPAILSAHPTLVISPLISLMIDQVDHLSQLGIPASCLHSQLPKAERMRMQEQLLENQLKLLYVAPEQLTNYRFIQLSQQLKFAFVILDEAHCLSLWGHDFRPAYLQIKQFINQLPERPTVGAFTATATPLTLAEIAEQSGLVRPQLFRASFFRPNLSTQVLRCGSMQEKKLLLIHLLTKHFSQSGIIYVATRHSAEELAWWLNQISPKQFSLTLAAYHGGLTAEQRLSIQKQFMENKIQVIVATNAFGMGVDKPDIRFVIHFQFPGSLENYYQEIGRGGRDGEPAVGYTLYWPPDKKIQLDFLSTTSKLQRQHQLSKLRQVVRFFETKACRQVQVLHYFGESPPFRSCQHCDNCLGRPLQFTEVQRTWLNIIRNWTSQQSAQSKIPQQYILPFSTQVELVLKKPTSPSGFLMISGIGLGWLERWYSLFYESCPWKTLSPEKT